MNVVNPQNDSREYPGMIISQAQESKDDPWTTPHDHNIQTQNEYQPENIHQQELNCGIRTI
jgi:hypothetical protein